MPPARSRPTAPLPRPASRRRAAVPHYGSVRRAVATPAVAPGRPRDIARTHAPTLHC